MINVTIRKPKKTNRWTEYSFGFRVGEHGSRDAAVRAVEAKLKRHKAQCDESGFIMIHEEDGSITTIEV